MHGTKIQKFWVPRNGSNRPKIAQNFTKMAIFHNNAMKWIVVSPKILPTYIIEKNIAILRNLGTQNGPHFGYLDFSKCVFSNVFTFIYVKGVFGDTTIYFMSLIWKNDHFNEILGHFGPFWAFSRYPENQNFFPVINIHNIQKMAIFGQIFTKWGPFWVPRFLKICF